MKILTIMGTRPEIIRLSQIIPKLDKLCNHYLVHTGQSYDYNMSKVFFEELGIRKPDSFFGVKSDTFTGQIAKILTCSEIVCNKFQPDKLLILGDTNSALSSIIAKRMGIPVYHMEAGNRCFDDKVPEENNRRIIDHSSDVLLPYTERSRANLIREGIQSQRIFVIGNPIFEVLEMCRNKYFSKELENLNLKPNKYFLVTVHREENVLNKHRLLDILTACSDLSKIHPVIFSRHPRTASIMELHKMDFPSINFHEPFGFREFLELERKAACVITDSGTVTEECCIAHIRCVTVRDTTERPETIECGSNIIAGTNKESIVRCVRAALDSRTDWIVPPEYTRKDVSDTVIKILLSKGGGASQY